MVKRVVGRRMRKTNFAAPSSILGRAMTTRSEDRRRRTECSDTPRSLYELLRATWRLLITRVTPSTRDANCSALLRCSGVSTVPVKDTTPFVVSTSMRVKFEGLSATSAALTDAVSAASSILRPGGAPSRRLA